MNLREMYVALKINIEKMTSLQNVNNTQNSKNQPSIYILYTVI